MRLELDLNRDGARSGGRLGWALDAGNGTEERREVAPDDLRRRPPERLGADQGGIACTAADLMPEVARLSSRQEQPAQHRPERLRCDARAGNFSNHLGGRVRLLGSDPALLDGEAGDIARGKDVRKAVHLAVRVDGKEAFDRLWEAVDPRAPKTRQRDDAVGRNPSLGNEMKLAVHELDRAGAGLDGDAPLLE